MRARHHKGKIRMEKANKANKRVTEKIMVCKGNVVMVEYDERYRPSIQVMRGT